ncbi:MAG TPA: glycosyl hydrolase family 28-related protein [Flavobacterium sp.]|jgi:hypothetical protein
METFMKRILPLVCLFITLSVHSQSPPPQGIRYDAIAYNTPGVPLPANTTIGLRISILDDIGGAVLFTETKTTQTRLEGLFTIIIGENNATFAAIDWGGGDHFLQMEIDPAGGTTYTQNGVTQLMSVPYAFYSGTSGDGISYGVVDNIATLRTTPGQANRMVYVKGYAIPGDGGSGYFMWKTDVIFRSSNYYNADNGGTIIKVANNDSGRWVRQYQGYLNVAWFGAAGNWGNYTTALQNAINFAELVAEDNVHFFINSTVYIPAGFYLIDSLMLKDGVSIKGDSMERTLLFPSTAPVAQLFTIEAGRVRINISDIQVRGSYGSSGISGKMVFNFDAQSLLYDGVNDGGLMNSTFRNITIMEFGGHAMLFKGWSALKYNRNIILENLKVTKGDVNSQTNALRMEGLNRMFTIRNCDFLGGPWNVFSRGNNVTLKGTGQPGSDLDPMNVTFNGCTFGNGDVGLKLESVENVTVDNCIFDGTGDAVFMDGITKKCLGINILNSRFSNGSGYGTLTPPDYVKDNGYCIKVKNSFASIRNNYSIASDICQTCGFVSGYGDSEGIELKGNSFLLPILARTAGVMQPVTQVGSTLLCRQNYMVNATGTSGSVTTLYANINVGETVTIRADSPISFNKTGNMHFPGSNTLLTLNAGEVAEFVRSDIGFKTYYLVSITRNNP